MYFSGTDAAKIITILNKCDFTIWPGYQIGFPLGDGELRPVSSGFELSAGASLNLTVAHYATVWGRTGCSFNESGLGTCITGDCDGRLSCGDDETGWWYITPQPVTHASLRFGEDKFPDVFALNVGDGYNIPISITPYGGSNGGEGRCKATSCSIDLNKSCPDELKVRSNGSTVACRNPCLRYFSPEPQFCCPYGYERGDCQPTNYYEVFEAACPSAGAAPEFDSSKSSVCSYANNYLISFC